jgi:hypothetical protein
LAALEREASRIGAAYATVRNLLRELALQQVHAIDQLSHTLADLEHDREQDRDGSVRIDGDISIKDVQSMGIAAEFSKDDLESETRTHCDYRSVPPWKCRSC